LVLEALEELAVLTAVLVAAILRRPKPAPVLIPVEESRRTR